jgi:hypothetical protein
VKQIDAREPWATTQVVSITFKRGMLTKQLSGRRHKQQHEGDQAKDLRNGVGKQKNRPVQVVSHVYEIGDRM